MKTEIKQQRAIVNALELAYNEIKRASCSVQRTTRIQRGKPMDVNSKITIENHLQVIKDKIALWQNAGYDTPKLEDMKMKLELRLKGY